MSHSKKRIIQTMRHKARKRGKTDKQIAKDRKAWACGRKVIFMSLEEAEQKATELGQTAYKCGYGDHWHTAHLPGSRRFTRRAA
jgi:hypothetical protein